MIKISNNDWGSSGVADNLTRQLFSKVEKTIKKNKSRTGKNNVKSKGLGNQDSFSAKNSLVHNRIILKSNDKKLKKTSEQKLLKSVDDDKIIDQAKKSNVKRKNGKNKRVKKGIVKDNEVESKPSLNKQMKAKNKKKLQKKLMNCGEQENAKINVKKLKQLLSLKEKKPTIKKSESLRDRMMAQLRASRFRFLNETLYTNASYESRKLFKEDPEAFAAYHEGYKQQIVQWPMNPLDVIIESVRKMPKDYIIADFGCGEARLAASVNQKVHSFDFVAINDKVVACDMAHTPLLIGGANVVVFCLSLMGTNLNDYLREANRVLKKDGMLKIAEVESRFDNVEEFINLLESFGFKNTWRDLSHNLFYFMDFKKVSDVTGKNSKLPEVTLKPCLYKKR